MLIISIYSKDKKNRLLKKDYIKYNYLIKKILIKINKILKKILIFLILIFNIKVFNNNIIAFIFLKIFFIVPETFLKKLKLLYFKLILVLTLI